MPTYLMLTNLTAEGVRTLKNNPSRVAEVNKEVEQIGARVVAQYATLGQYDFVTVVEAPDEKTMAKVSVELGSSPAAVLLDVINDGAEYPRTGKSYEMPLSLRERVDRAGGEMEISRGMGVTRVSISLPIAESSL